MKKKVLLMALLTMVLFTGCNRAIIDMTYGYDKAIIKLANDEVIEVEIKTWCDYEGEQLQIEAKDGTIYLVSSYRCDLIKTE